MDFQQEIKEMAYAIWEADKTKGQEQCWQEAKKRVELEHDLEEMVHWGDQDR